MLSLQSYFVMGDKLMGNLVVRNIDESIVKALKERAGQGWP